MLENSSKHTTRNSSFIVRLIWEKNPKYGTNYDSSRTTDQVTENKTAFVTNERSRTPFAGQITPLCQTRQVGGIGLILFRCLDIERINIPQQSYHLTNLKSHMIAWPYLFVIVISSQPIGCVGVWPVMPGQSVKNSCEDCSCHIDKHGSHPIPNENLITIKHGRCTQERL